MRNSKPYRTKDLKRIAHSNAKKNKDGYFTSDVKVYFHGDKCEPHRCVCAAPIKLNVQEAEVE
jgi:hypothetical protein